MAEDSTNGKLANPAVLGLMAFGLTTLLLNLHNVGLFGMDNTILAMGLFFGGSAQIIAGVLEYKKGNTFGTTAFTAYGAFWLTLVFVLVVGPYLSEGAPGIATSTTGLGWYMAVWGLFTGLMFIGTLKVNRALQAVFLCLTILFFILAFHFWLDSSALQTAAGVVGIITAFTAIYLAIAELLNEMYGKVILPIGPMAVEYKHPEDL
ncbi:MAG: acetate uptake transporter [Actinobacteria bacterium]|nr:acetate uptake transporter [Actinomycetota bacterium]